MSKFGEDCEYISLFDVSQARAVTPAVASWILTLYPELVEPYQKVSLEEAIESACFSSLPSSQHPQTPRRDQRSHEGKLSLNPGDSESASRPVKIYTTYDALLAYKEFGFHDESVYIFVDDEEEADFMFLTTNIRNFQSINAKVNQFPFEGGLVQKDLLPLTVRGFCYQNGTPPKWWLPCFDLTTEFHFFAEEYRFNAMVLEDGNTDFTPDDGAYGYSNPQEVSPATTAESSDVKPDMKIGGDVQNNQFYQAKRFVDKISNSWIVKPATGTRGQGHTVINEPGELGLQMVACAAPMLTDLQMLGRVPRAIRNDFVAQKFVANPLLVRSKKFDLRIMCAIRSFEPFEGFMFKNFYARVANKPYDVTAIDDPEVGITVQAYNENRETASKQGYMTNAQLRAHLDEEYIDGTMSEGHPAPVEYGWESVCESLRKLSSELFQGVAPSVGHWPRSTAYYGIDVMLDLETEQVGEGEMEALEEKYISMQSSSATIDTGDLLAAQRAFIETVRSCGHLRKIVPRLIEVNFLADFAGVEVASENRMQYFQWVDDLMRCLATERLLDPERIIAL
jgi:hypothetical protein